MRRPFLSATRVYKKRKAQFFVPAVLLVFGILAVWLLLAKSTREPSSAPSGPPSGQEILRGDMSARIILVEYFDLECPFCRQYAQEVEPGLITQYKGRSVGFAYRHLPLTHIHRMAFIEAEVLECAARESRDAYLPAMEMLLTAESTGTSSAVRAVADPLGLNARAIEMCVEKGEARPLIAQSVINAHRQGIYPTPTFSIYKDGIERARVVGGRAEQLRSSINLLLSEL